MIGLSIPAAQQRPIVFCMPPAARGRCGLSGTSATGRTDPFKLAPTMLDDVE
jgi:hypothetical protein